jgi:tetratricopeptide (TPR) repeat protein
LDATLQLLRGEQIGQDPKRWSYWQRRTGNQLANEFFQAGDTLNALAVYQGLIALSPEPAWRLPATYQIALCYERMRLYDRAAAAYQSIVDAAVTPVPDAAKKPGTAEAAKPASDEIAELARMAAWRLTQLSWHEQTEKQLSSVFTSGAEASAKAPPTATPLAPNIEHNAPSQPATPAHDQPGKPPATPENL